MFERTSVGLDVHARSVAGCALDTETGEILHCKLTPDRAEIIDWIRSLPGPVRVVYEAGPTGFGLARDLNDAGFPTMVAAPSKLQRPSGDRVKTDTRCTWPVAETGRDHRGQDSLDRSGSSPGPGPDTGGLPGGSDARSRHRISKLLLRQGIVYSDGQAWTGQHGIWLNRQHFPEPARELTYRSCLAGMRAIDERRHNLDAAITSMALDSEFTAAVQCLGCLRGVSTLTAFGLAVEIGDWDRFTGSSIGAYFGLVPSEHSSGASRSRGSITKTGNTDARRLLVEAAWHHRRPT